MEFLGFIINSEMMTVYLPTEKVGTIITRCEKLLRAELVTIREMTSLLGLLILTYQAVLPVLLHYRSLQRQQIRNLQETEYYETQITLTLEGREELIWWVRNLNLNEGKPISILTPDLIIQSDAAKTGGGGNGN